MEHKTAGNVVEEVLELDLDGDTQASKPKQFGRSLKVDKIDLSTWEGVVETVTSSRPNLGRILERKAKLVEFNEEAKYIKVHIPTGGLREPKEILQDFISELEKLGGEPWKVELPMAAELNISMQTLHQQNLEAKANLIQQVKDTPVIKKILNDLVEAEVIDVIRKAKN